MEIAVVVVIAINVRKADVAIVAVALDVMAMTGIIICVALDIIVLFGATITVAVAVMAIVHSLVRGLVVVQKTLMTPLNTALRSIKRSKSCTIIPLGPRLCLEHLRDHQRKKASEIHPVSSASENSNCVQAETNRLRRCGPISTPRVRRNSSK
ncbi:hypothetical protein GE09DRAFT_714224 [Coniochaeta sp. 2T2.1]|nr:hypothetical protein GE09DRAFT_714224 [Coniochaeta sp. 2T2.1]